VSLEKKDPHPADDRRPVERRGPARRPPSYLLLSIVVAGLVLIALLVRRSAAGSDVERNFDVIVGWLHEGRLDGASLEYIELEHAIRGKIVRPAGEAGPRRFELRSGEGMALKFFGELQKHNARFPEEPKKMLWPRGVHSTAGFWTGILALIPWVVFALILYFLFLRGLRTGGPGGSVLSFGKSRARLATKESPRFTFADVAGIEEAKGEVREVIEFLKNPGRFQRLGGRIPRGIILVGSPGTGKTLLAKAIAGEADVPFFSICGSDFVEMFVGVGASRIRDLFKQARENSPCIIFLDEVDAVGRRRGSGIAGGHDEREQTLNAILVEMDGFNSDEGIIVIGATNRPDVLDPALLRPGRFDREIAIDLPDLRGREEILHVHARKVKLDPSVDLHRLARGTATFSGAELAALVNEAAIIAAMGDQSAIAERDLEEARDKIRWGRQKTSRVLTEEDRRITAYHEAGHALAAHLLPEVEPLHKVTIIPRGMALGSTMQLPERDRYHLSKKHLLANIAVLYAGRVAEELFCGDVTAGAKNDIERATELARLMVTEWGMSEAVGPVHYAPRDEPALFASDAGRAKSYSETMAQRIDEEVRRILEECYQRTQKLIRKHRLELERIAQALLVKETLTGDEVEIVAEGGQVGLPAAKEAPPRVGAGAAPEPQGKRSSDGAPDERRSIA